MKIRILRNSLLLSAMIISITAFGKDDKADTTVLPAGNPFKNKSILPFFTPDFSKIKESDIKPAIEAGINEQLKEIEKIANNPAAPTFENTLVALERSGQLFMRANNVLNLLTGANTNPVLQEMDEELAPKKAARQDAIRLNGKLFSRIEKIYNDLPKLKLNMESKRLVEYQYQQFILAGAKLSESDKAEMRKLNEEEASLKSKFSNVLINAGKVGAVLIEDKSQLSGASQADIDAYAENAKAKNYPGKYLIPLQNTTQQPILQSLTNRATREKIFNASWNRATQSDSNDTRAVISRLAIIRAQQAKLLGFKSYAALKLSDQMAATPEAVQAFFAKIVPSVNEKAKSEAATIQSFIDKQNGKIKLQPWDWNFYAEQVRKEKYNLDEKEIKPYFELNTVLEKGVFFAANQLYGLSFKERFDIPKYQEDVRVFEVFDKDKKPLALFYGDYFKRDNKSGGAWMSNLVEQSKLLGTKPVIYNVCNFTKPAKGQPALISFSDVTTMFHEFGHSLHGMLADQKYITLSGTNTARDFVEFPSQFNEHWALDPKILKNYAIHINTKQVIPQSLVDKIKNAGSFNSGYTFYEAIAAAALDLQWHTLSADNVVPDADKFEKEALRTTGLDLPQVPPRYRSSYFKHIWSNDYAAGYYAYQWTKMLSEDAFDWFKSHGGLTRTNGDRFRNMVLSRGNTIDLNKMYKDFRGQAPDIKALRKALGISEE